MTRLDILARIGFFSFYQAHLSSNIELFLKGFDRIGKVIVRISMCLYLARSSRQSLRTFIVYITAFSMERARTICVFPFR